MRRVPLHEVGDEGPQGRAELEGVARRGGKAAVEPAEKPRLFLSIGLPFACLGRPAFLAAAKGELVADARHGMAINAALAVVVAAPLAEPRLADMAGRG